MTAIWLSPVFKQRGHLDTFHGYGIQDFLEVDPRFGTRRDLVELVAEAHRKGVRVILDIIFNHSGANWVYPNNDFQPGYSGPLPAGTSLPVERTPDGAAFISIRNLPPSEVLVLTNYP